MFKIIFVLVLTAWVASGECPLHCHCTRYNTFCTNSYVNSLPRGLPSTTEVLSMEGDFVIRLNSSVVNATSLESLISLKLVNMHIHEIKSLTFVYMRKLESLTITGNDLFYNLESKAFKGLTELYHLDLSRNSLSILLPRTFEGLVQLRYLNLSYNRIQRIHSGAFDGLSLKATSIKSEIDLSGNDQSLEEIDEGALKGLQSFSSMKIQFSRELRAWPKYLQGLRGMRRLSISVGDCWSRKVHNSTTDRMSKLYNLRYLDITDSCLLNIPDRFLENSTLLSNLSLVRCQIKKLNVSSFHGLKSLKTLNLRSNKLNSLNNYVFQHLISLRELDLSHNYIKTIEVNTFRNLRQLVFLHLNHNRLTSLPQNVFSDLNMLRELNLAENDIDNIDEATLSGLASLKSLHLAEDYVSYYIYKDVFTKGTIECPERLDSFQGSGEIVLKGIYTMKNLHIVLKGDDFEGSLQKSVGINNIYLQHPISLTIYGLKSSECLEALTQYKITNLGIRLYSGNVIENQFSCFPNLKKLLIAQKYGLIQKGAFNSLHNLEDLTIKWGRLESGAFKDLSNLNKLVLDIVNFEDFSRNTFQGLKNVNELVIYTNGIKALYYGSFRDMENLKLLSLSDPVMSTIETGSFLGLNNLQTLKLPYNRISNISSGIFGAVCEEDFDLTCQNLTRLAKYCNVGYALKSLKHLELKGNRIQYIHPHAFLGCSQLEELDLSDNHMLTLDNDFLFIPELRTLKMQECNVSIIKTSSFSCTTKLSNIDLYYNNIEYFHLSAFHHLKALKTINFPFTFSLDCAFKELWLWLRCHGVQFDFLPYFDLQLHSLQCNTSLKPNNRHTERKSSSTGIRYFKIYIEPIILIFIFLSGSFSNGFLIFIILRHSDMRTKQNACLLHLVICDILSLIMNLPLSYWVAVYPTWDLGETLCKIFLVCKDLTVALVVFSVLVFSMERCLVVWTSFKMKKVCDTFLVSNPTLYLVFTWFIAIVTTLPTYFSAIVRNRCLFCEPYKTHHIQRIWTFQLSMYCFFPACLIVASNVLTTYTLKKSIKEVPGEIRNQVREANRDSVANMVTILSVVFLCSYVPNFLLRSLVSWSIVKMEDVFWYSFVTYCFFFCHSVLNPIAVFITGSKFKTHFLRYVRFLSVQKDEQIQSDVNLEHGLQSAGKLLLDLEETLAGNTQVEVPVFPQDEAARIALAQSERIQRLKNLQKRFL